jgi:iron complex outermembrane receptor protein
VDKKSVSAPGLLFSPTYEKTEAAWSGRAGLAYEFANGLTPYASAATFFNPVFDANPNLTGGASQPFRPETGHQFEAGIKYRPGFMDALITASAFHLVKQNVLNPAPTVVNPFAQQQLGEVTSTGFEFEAKANITENLKVLAAFTAFDLETTKDSATALCRQDAPDRTGGDRVGLARLHLLRGPAEGCQPRRRRALCRAVLGRQ